MYRWMDSKRGVERRIKEGMRVKIDAGQKKEVNIER